VVALAAADALVTADPVARIDADAGVVTRATIARGGRLVRRVVAARYFRCAAGSALQWRP
jgi:hypothetical protein